MGAVGAENGVVADLMRGENMRKELIVGIVVALIAAAVLAKVGLSGSDSPPSAAADDEIRIPLSELSEKATWYEYKPWEITVKYFAVKAEDGSIKTGFDACDVCYRTKKGYSQNGSYMVCNNCGNRYPVIGLGTENKTPGGCWPGYLPSYVDGEYLVIKTSDLDKGRWMFA